MKRIAVVLVIVGSLAAACSNAQPAKFSVTGASVDPTYFCPGGANNARYDLHGTVDVHNPTSGTVTIDAVSTELTLVAVQGAWLEKVGDRYDAGDATFSPKTVGAGSNKTITVTISSACTSDRYESGGSSRGEYSVTIHLTPTAGTYTDTARNHHQILAA
jgi:hypothetical protein